MNKCNKDTQDLNPKTNRCCKKCSPGLIRHPIYFTRCIKGTGKLQRKSPVKKNIFSKTTSKNQDVNMFKDMFPNFFKNKIKKIFHKFILKNPPVGTNNVITILGKNYTFEQFVNLIWKLIEELGSTISNTKTHSYIVSWDANRNMKTELSFSTSFQFSNYIDIHKSSNNTVEIDYINALITIIHNKKSFTKKIVQ